MMNQIHLIRHSLTEANEKWLYCGFSDLPLSPNGVILLRHKALEGGYPIGHNCRFYSSGLLRAEQTLEGLYGETNHEILPDMREMNFGEFELHSYDYLKDTPVYQKWLNDGGENHRCPGGENGDEFRHRVLNTTEKLLTGGDSIVVCHGGVIAAVMSYFFHDDSKSRYDWQPKPVEGYTMIIDNGIPVDYHPIPVQYFDDVEIQNGL